jgi:hypothetical protein
VRYLIKGKTVKICCGRAAVKWETIKPEYLRLEPITKFNFYYKWLQKLISVLSEKNHPQLRTTWFPGSFILYLDLIFFAHFRYESNFEIISLCIFLFWRKIMNKKFKLIATLPPLSMGIH